MLRDDQLIFYGSINTPSAAQPSTVGPAARSLAGRWHPRAGPRVQVPRWQQLRVPLSPSSSSPSLPRRGAGTRTLPTRGMARACQVCRCVLWAPKGLPLPRTHSISAQTVPRRGRDRAQRLAHSSGPGLTA